MISCDDHPPSDHRIQQKFHDLDRVKSLVADLDDTSYPQPSFCIREYVFDSRRKDIACNWPFSENTLQICLQNGVKNLLPPFQSLELLTNNSSNEKFISTSDRKSNPELTFKSRKSKKSQTHPQEDSGQTKSNKSIKKICPVCKTFTSSSNTTLNAHIDQCLAGKSSMTWTPCRKVVINHRIKPRKTRLMVDIYKTATNCTVEELDARNGTGWANNSSFSIQELEFQGQEGSRTIIVVPGVSDHHEGDVYIDTDGTKVRILSVPKVDNRGARKTLKLSKSFMGKKKNKNHEHKHGHERSRIPNRKKLFSSKPSEVTISGREVTVGINGEKEAMKPYVRMKKLCLSKPSEVTSGRDVTVDIGRIEPMKPEMRTKMDDLPIVRPPWACSKRSGPRHNTKTRSRVEEDASGKTSSESRNLPENSISRNETRARKNLEFSKCDNMFESWEMYSDDFMKKSSCVDDVTEEVETKQIYGQVDRSDDYDSMSDSFISTVSNPSFARSDSDKFSVRSTSQKDVVNDENAPVEFKNDQLSIGGPSKLVLRLMGKNLTVVNTDHDELNRDHFPNLQNGCNFPSLGCYQNGGIDINFRSATCADYYQSPRVGPTIPASEDRSRSDGQIVSETNHTPFGYRSEFRGV